MSTPAIDNPDSCRGLALQAACRFRQLFARAFVRWETCGWLRREVGEGPRELVHVAIPSAGGDVAGGNPLWARAAQVVALERAAPAGKWPLPPDPEHVVLDFELDGWQHRLIRATPETWGLRLVEHTGPPWLWKMLLWRLRESDALTVSRGLVCVIDRAAIESPRLVPVPCRDEATFFRLARTKFKEPRWRFDTPTDGDERHPPEWRRGILPEWYPAGVKIYASPRQPGLFDTSRTVNPRFVGKDGEKWLRS